MIITHSVINGWEEEGGTYDDVLARERTPAEKLLGVLVQRILIYRLRAVSRSVVIIILANFIVP